MDLVLTLIFDLKKIPTKLQFVTINNGTLLVFDSFDIDN